MDGNFKVLCQRGLKIDEGFRAKPYKCSAGKLTIGYGRNIEDVGISEDEALYLLNNDISYCYNKLYAVFPWFKDLDGARQYVLVNMCYNIGITALSKFVKTLQLVANKDYEAAAHEMLRSKWSEQVGDRADKLADIMENGEKSAELKKIFPSGNF